MLVRGNAGIDLLLRSIAFGDAPDAEDHSLCTVNGKFGSGFETEASVSTCDNDNLGGEALGWLRDAGPFLADEREDVGFHSQSWLTRFSLPSLSEEKPN